MKKTIITITTVESSVAKVIWSDSLTKEIPKELRDVWDNGYETGYRVGLASHKKTQEIGMIGGQSIYAPNT